MIGELATEHRKMARELNSEKAARLELESRNVADKEKSREAERLVAKARSEMEAAQTEVANLKLKVAAEKKKFAALKTEMASSQGELLKAFAEWIFYSGGFSALASSLASVLNVQVHHFVIDKIAEDHPDLDKLKYSYEVVGSEALARDYVEVLVDRWPELPVVKHLTALTLVLNADYIHRCPIDKDDTMDALAISIAEEQRLEDELTGDMPVTFEAPMTTEGPDIAEADAENDKAGNAENTDRVS